ncbi:RNA exonuclease 3 [Fusarium tjaetaba]|uniref:RNA exonuclease 3 n=1 Tax=Fusarium tjaetaba TaxID=1567544 RepID=A0A8H5QEC4_9HYPO|nr:RNA exonuclease 3 [Fusarium tjaetaba]KAF5613078.1 RNA exonuclease 3 [Fusarium tjaetaba]
MAKADQDSKRRCKICSVSFKTDSQFAEHCLDADHQGNQCCEHCIRWFCSIKALAQHNKAKHARLPEVVPVQQQEIKLPAPLPSLEYHFRDLSYKRSPLLDLATIHNRLILQCHSPERLKKEGYILGRDGCSNGGLAAITNETRMPPYPDPLWPKRKAAALNCEMVGVRSGDSEIISIRIIDFSTGEVLVNTLVKPMEPIIQWRTNVHGICPATLSTAASQGRVLYGWEAIRQQLFKHINTETVIVGQSLQKDLKGLRVSHAKIFDTAIVTAEAVFGPDADFGRRWSLQSLCADLLKLCIRKGPNAHDALEEAMAAREVALWCICYPDRLKRWAERARKKHNTERVKQTHLGRNGRRKMYYQHNGGEGDIEVPEWAVVDVWTWPSGH